MIVSLDIEQLDPAALWRVMEVTRQLQASADLSESLALVVQASLDVLNADRATVFLYDEGSNELYSKIATGAGEIRFPADKGIAGECATKRDVINVPDCYADARFNQQVDKKTGYRTRCLLTLPLIGHGDALVGVLQVLNKVDGVFDHIDENLGLALAAQCAASLQKARFIEDMMAKEKMERDLKVAREIQSAILPEVLPEIPGYDIAAHARPADETGGDIYDVVTMEDGRVFFMLGDATGHGIGPALSISQVRAMTRMGLLLGADLDQLFNEANTQLYMDLPSNRFVTALFGVICPKDHELTYHAGGQGPMLKIAADGSYESFEATIFPMGIVDELPPSEAELMNMQPGEMFALMTDGFFEAPSPNEELFGQQRVVDVLNEYRDESCEKMIQALYQAVDEYTEGQAQADDMTILLLKRNVD